MTLAEYTGGVTMTIGGTDVGWKRRIFFHFIREQTKAMSSADTVREQFSALQKQQKERLTQLQSKATKKKVSTADVRSWFVRCGDHHLHSFRRASQWIWKSMPARFHSKRWAITFHRRSKSSSSLCSIEPQCHRLDDRQPTRKSKWTDSSKTPSFSRVLKWRLTPKELRDENGRLRKLLGEKDYEIGYLRRIQEEERQAFIGTVSVTGFR